jgi:hypothetical protein
MRSAIAISAASAVLGYVLVYCVFFSKPAPQAEPDTPTAVEAAEPAVLAAVVDVTDLDPLLDPPPARPTGVPFDPTEPPEPTARVSASPPALIPPAAD